MLSKTKLDALLELVGWVDPSAIFILSGGIVRIGPNGSTRFRSTAYRDLDPHGLCTAGKTRVVAAAELSQAFPGTAFVTTSRVEPEFPSHAAVMATELERLGVPPHRIVLEERSMNTLTELIEMVKLARRHGWARIGVLTNGYHFPRLRAMVKRLRTLAPESDAEFHAAWDEFIDKRGLTLIASEDVLRLRSPRYARLIAAAEATDAFRGRLAAEWRGLAALENGSYAARLTRT